MSRVHFSPVGGDCLGPEWRGVLAVVDPAAPIASGDMVRIGFVLRGETHFILKELRHHEGKWFAWCHEGVVPIAGYALVPDRIEKVVGREPLLGAPPDVPTQLRATDADRAIFEHFTRDAVAHWAVHGHDNGVPWPGLDAVVGPRPPSHQIEPATHATLPLANPTRPSEPQNFTLRTLAGTIVLDWDEPVVRPMGTEYDVIASPNSADASVGSVVWTGAADQVSVPWATFSPYFWHVRARANSYVSAYVPNTFGVLGIPAPAPNQLGFPIPDPQFQQGPSVGSYWEFSGGSAGYTLVGSGGLSPASGVFSFTGSAGVFARLYPTRRVIAGPPALNTTFPLGGGRGANISVTFRRTTALAGSGGQAGFELNFDVGANGVGFGPAINSSQSYVRCDTVALNTWVTYTTSAVINANSGCDSAEASLRFNSTLCSSGTIQIGRFDVALI